MGNGIQPGISASPSLVPAPADMSTGSIEPKKNEADDVEELNQTKTIALKDRIARGPSKGAVLLSASRRQNTTRTLPILNSDDPIAGIPKRGERAEEILGNPSKTTTPKAPPSSGKPATPPPVEE